MQQDASEGGRRSGGRAARKHVSGDVSAVGPPAPAPAPSAPATTTLPAARDVDAEVTFLHEGQLYRCVVRAERAARLTPSPLH